MEDSMFYLTLVVNSLLAVQVGRVLGSLEMGIISFTFGVLLIVLVGLHASLVRRSFPR
jgi:hypothetical protein